MTRSNSAYAPIACGLILCTWTACDISFDDVSSLQDAASPAMPVTSFDAGVRTQPVAAEEDAGAMLPPRGGEPPPAGRPSDGGVGGHAGAAGGGETSPQGPREAPGYIEERDEPEDKSKKCVDVMNAKDGDPVALLEGRRIQFWDCSKDRNPAQRWTFFSDHTIRAFDMCLTAVEENEAGRVFLELRTCEGLAMQLWWLCSGQLLNEAYGTCLDLMDEANRQNGGSVQLWTCFNAKANQSWQLPGALEEVNEEACMDFPPAP